MEFNIRQATFSDKNALNQLQESCFDEKTRENFDYVLNDKNYLFLVAESNKQMMGYIGVSISFESSDLLTICVDKSYRGKGIAKSLVFSMIEILKGKNVEHILLEVNENNTNAIKLYEKIGFDIISKRKNYYGKDSAFIMKKIL